MAESPAEPLISMRGISKRFPGVQANDNVDLDICSGEVHALLGENGAGKSTLVKILYGFYEKDSGEVKFEGQPVSIESPKDARQRRIGLVFQEMTLIPAMSVLENIALFLTELALVLNLDQLADRIRNIGRQYGLEVNPFDLVWQLSIGQQQKVEILKLLMSDARLLILDEPTRVLAPHEVEALFSIFENLRNDGYAILFITHKLPEVLACADRITVMRHGRVAGKLMRRDASEDRLVTLMFGTAPPKKPHARHQAAMTQNGPLLELRNVETQADGVGTSLRGIDLVIGRGEIVGVAGVSGNGQRELGDVIIGLERAVTGKIYFSGKDCTGWTARRLRQNGLAFIPENPLTMAAIPLMTVQENMALGNTRSYQRHGGLSLDWTDVARDLGTSFEQLGLSAPDVKLPVRTLSGGNLQRLILARELARDPILIIALYPTRGLDVMGTVSAQRDLLAAKDAGKGVLLISEDLGELFSVCDRLLVLFKGKIVGEFSPNETSMKEVGYLMTGSELSNGAQLG